MAGCTFSPRTNRARNAVLLNMHSWPAARNPIRVFEQPIAHSASAGGSPSGCNDGPHGLELLPWDGAVPVAVSQPSSPKEFSPGAGPQPLHTCWSADLTVAAGERLYSSALHSMHRHRQQTDQILQVSCELASMHAQHTLQAHVACKGNQCGYLPSVCFLARRRCGSCRRPRRVHGP